MFTEALAEATMFIVVAEAHAETGNHDWAWRHWAKAANSYLLSERAEDAPVNGDSIRESVATDLLGAYAKLKQLQEELDLRTTNTTLEHGQSVHPRDHLMPDSVKKPMMRARVPA